MSGALPSPATEFIRELRALTGRRRRWEVFADFCETATMSIASWVDRRPERVARYQAALHRYSVSEGAAFGRMLGCAALGVSLSTDMLGGVFEELGLAEHWEGQFFSPMDVCRATVRVAVDPLDAHRRVEAAGFVIAFDPACGAGALPIALAGWLAESGLNPQRHLHVTAVDLDRVAAQMAYIQLSLLGIPAVVRIGDTLLEEMAEEFRTPMHLLGRWDRRLAGRAGTSTDVQLLTERMTR